MKILRARISFATVAFLCIYTQAALSELPLESIGQEKLDLQPSAHWVWVSNLPGTHLESGHVYLMDGDGGKMLGKLTTGVMFQSLTLTSDYSSIYSVESYYSRGARGVRTDLITNYDPVTLKPISEIEIPTKRATNYPTVYNSHLTDDDRFLLVYNYTPAQSVTVVDMNKNEMLGEIDTAGCALVYPSGSRRFHMLCGNGGMLTIVLNEKGKEIYRHVSEPFFSVADDPIEEDGVRIGDQYLFTSHAGKVYSVDVSENEPVFHRPWDLLSDNDRQEMWRPGGLQLIAASAGTGNLYVSMHQGGKDTQAHPGSEIWVYDISKKKRILRITAVNPVSSLNVSKDKSPLLFTIFGGGSSMDIYDAVSGKHLRTVEYIGDGPSVIQTPLDRVAFAGKR